MGMDVNSPYGEVISTHDPRLCLPFPTRCTSYSRLLTARCKAAAEALLFAPDGEPSPGAYVCRTHGERLLTEYREKIMEKWELRDTHLYGPGCIAAHRSA